MEQEEKITGAKGWLKCKSELYSKIAAWNIKKVDQVLFDFADCSAEIMGLSVFVNGVEECHIAMRNEEKSFLDLKNWMESVLDEKRICSEMRIDVALKWFVFHYEHLGIDEKNRDIGLFCVCCTEAYSSIKGKITVMAICDTKRFVSMLYTKLLRYSSEYHTYRHIVIDWGFSGSKGIPANWSFYNCLKSPKIEWYCDPDVEPGATMPTFKKKPCVKETVHLWCDYGGAVFWDYKGVCTGDSDGFDYGKDYENEIDLSDMPELEEWYDEFDKFDDPCDDRNDDDYEKWFKKGWHLAKKIRKRMPANVDLFYEWKHYLRKAGKKEEYDSVPLTVPDERLIKK